MTPASPLRPALTADLSGKTILLTGASRGFGRSFARLLASMGAEVIAAARSADALDGLVTEIAREGGRARALSMDVSNSGSIEAAFAHIPKVDVLVNNAGIGGTARALKTSPDQWREVYATNVDGAFAVACAAANRMIETGTGGSIINIASITGIRPGVAVPAYSSSKSAVIGMTRALAGEWARYGIRVNAIAPGYFATDLSGEFLESDYGKAMQGRIPMRRFGELHELAGPLLLLASDASSFMSGAVIEVDGGHLCAPL
ncbi:SDR family NAD(P)-dependent oxidoreductase [Hyphomonas sp. NPDC076900]|uniref:SDR family NAD(P)-dependent oxidoreductase n=1 Tax=unclassified Hyphomonas TaxID=2630699 RepID=UPI003D01FAED